jgi:hypothetical protein
MSIEADKQTPRIDFGLAGSFVYDGVRIDPQELFKRYESSPLGIEHAKQRPRFAQEGIGYGYEPLEQFQDDLGIDVHPVRHMLYTHNTIAMPLIIKQQFSLNAQKFTPDGVAEVKTTAMLHDVGECTHPEIADALGIVPGGDRKYGTHSEQDKIDEKRVRNYIFAKYFPDLPPRLLARVNQIDEKEDMDDFPTLAFNVVERFGYLTSAMRAALIVRHEEYTPGDERIAQLGRLATIVSTTHYGFLRSQQETFPYLKPALDALMY